MQILINIAVLAYMGINLIVLKYVFQRLSLVEQNILFYTKKNLELHQLTIERINTLEKFTLKKIEKDENEQR